MRSTYRHPAQQLQHIHQVSTFFDRHPQGTVWLEWNRDLNCEEWRREFRAAIHRRINARSPQPQGRNHTQEAQADLRWDADRIREYVQFRARSSGCRNLLRTSSLKRRYPHIDNQTWDG